MTTATDTRAQAATGAHALVAALEAHGVTVVFGLPGVHALPVWDALATSGIRAVTVRHEQAAAFAAVAYGRLTGVPGVCLTSTGPGAMNALAGIGEADASSTPVLHVTSQIPTRLVGSGRGHLHETLGQSQAFAAVSRYHARPTTPAELAGAVDRAFAELATRSGPATIEAAVDVLAAPAPDGAPPVTSVAPPASDESALARVKRLLDEADAPLFWVGGGAARAADDVRALAERLDAPVVTTFNGKGVLPPGHPLHAGSSVEEAPVRALVERSDVCLALGTRFSQETTADWSLRLPPTVQVDVDGGRIGRSFPVAEGVVADAGAFCRALLALAPAAGVRDGEAAVRAALAGRAAAVGAQGADAELGVLRALGDALPADAVVISDMTVLGYWAAMYLDAGRPGSFIYPSSGALGCGVALGLGACAAAPERPVVAIVGDGGFLMGGHELLTAQAEGLPVVTLLVNDSSYGILRQYQTQLFGRTIAVDLNAPDFELLARSYGVRYLRAGGPDDLPARLREAIAARVGGPVLVELQAALQAPGQSV
jgi:thiamine pyrophosphate-dependent acetolactate synthase large subunit-like protein